MRGKCCGAMVWVVLGWSSLAAAGDIADETQLKLTRSSELTAGVNSKSELAVAATETSTSSATVTKGDTDRNAIAVPKDGDAPQWKHQVSGWASVDYFRSDNHLNDDTNFSGGTLNLKIASELSPSLSTKLELRTTNPSVFNRGDTTTSFTEAYATFNAEPFRIRAGKQIVAWGRTDGINPTDNLTPRDYLTLLPTEESQRFGTKALTVDAQLTDEYSLSLFTTPYFEPSRIPLPLDQAQFIDQKPSHRLSNSEFAARLNKAGGRVDWSASYFHGYSLFPDLRPAGFASGMPVLALTYAGMDVLGTDFSFNLGRYGIRGELAYNRMSDENRADPFSRKSFWYYVLGGDRTFDGNLNVNLQLFGRYVRNRNDTDAIADPLAQVVAKTDAILSGQQDSHSYGMTSRVSKTWWNETLKAELLAIVNFTRRNTYWRPLLTYDTSDHLKLSVGANIYRGDADTFFGRLEKNSGVFAEARYAF